jgi:predicted Rossmann fold flavoprotein
MNSTYDVIIIGAGAAGLMCAIEAGKRGRRVLLLDHMEKIAEKIRISGGGRCNFTNINAGPDWFLSENPHFCKSALKQYPARNFIELVQKHGISFHEKKLGQLFCDESSTQIIEMLLLEVRAAGVQLATKVKIFDIHKSSQGFMIKTSHGVEACASLVIATGGLSIPKIGATNFGYETAKKFNMNVILPRPGLVPLTFDGKMLEKCKFLSGLSVEANVSCGNKTFNEGFLFTHRGLSGPSILQISSYWESGKDIIVDLAPGTDIFTYLKEVKVNKPKMHIGTALQEFLPKRLAQIICDDLNCDGPVGGLAHAKLMEAGSMINAWRTTPTGTEGYRTAEVTLGGVDTKELSSRTMQSVKNPGLFFIGEVVDVTGHLGGFNFQWAWSSGYVAGQHV